MGKKLKEKDIEKRLKLREQIHKRRNSPEHKISISVGFVLLLILYFSASLVTVIVSRADGMLALGQIRIPFAAFTGVFSSIANICVIFMVVYFKKTGFISALVVLLIQFPILIMHFIMQKNMQSLPGLFSDVFTIIACFLIYKRNKKIEDYQEIEIDYFKEQQKFSQRLFEETATSLVNAIDAKDTYSHGHSMRVAQYSKLIAEKMGKEPEECYKIYYTALLHDVGKIGISNAIINKKGKLDNTEFETIKQHPVIGNQILSSITEYPYLSIGAHYHHERYDGKGYPSRLKGEDIPEVARIISVADAYDAMTSNRSYREALPQHIVREEIVKGMGTQFDPDMAKIMQVIIDQDEEYKLREQKPVKELSGKTGLHCSEYREEISNGILVFPIITKIKLKSTVEGNEKTRDYPGMPAIILFDSLDGRVHDDDRMKNEMQYYEYGEIWLDGRTVNSGVRKVKTQINEYNSSEKAQKESTNYEIEAVRIKDHVLIKIDDGRRLIEVTLALPDSSRYSYIGLTGDHCSISDVSIDVSDEAAPKDYIERIAEEISFINVPAGDIPNVQIDGYRYDASEAIEITDGLKIIFHTKSLPTARLIWHCPFIDVFYSADKKVQGEGYREYALIRLDGEEWQSDGISENDIFVIKDDEFAGWEAWKQGNKEGFDCEVEFKREGNKITVTSKNLGLYVRNAITITDGTKEVYAALTGDQCAITNIRIQR